MTCLPVAGFGCTPQEPSVFEPVRFFDYSYDPGGRGIIAWHWDFGDGSSSVEPRPTHHYGMDGDYDVSLTARTPDGRGGSSERVIRVRTHEVRIVSVEAPARCGTGERVAIRIELSSPRYDELCDVRLFLGAPAEGRFRDEADRATVAVRGTGAAAPASTTLHLTMPETARPGTEVTVEAVISILGVSAAAGNRSSTRSIVVAEAASS